MGTYIVEHSTHAYEDGDVTVRSPDVEKQAPAKANEDDDDDAASYNGRSRYI